MNIQNTLEKMSDRLFKEYETSIDIELFMECYLPRFFKQGNFIICIIQSTTSSNEVVGVGVSKRMNPTKQFKYDEMGVYNRIIGDEWNEERGKEIAFCRALRNLYEGGPNEREAQ